MQFTLKVYVAAQNREILLIPFIGGRGSWSFKVIDFGSPKKVVTSACYHKQHACIYMQPLSRYTSQ